MRTMIQYGFWISAMARAMATSPIQARAVPSRPPRTASTRASAKSCRSTCPRPGPERRAHSDFPGADGGAGKEQVRHVGARDEEHAEGGREHEEEDIGDLPGHVAVDVRLGEEGRRLSIRGVRGCHPPRDLLEIRGHGPRRCACARPCEDVHSPGLARSWWRGRGEASSTPISVEGEAEASGMTPMISVASPFTRMVRPTMARRRRNGSSRADTRGRYGAGLRGVLTLSEDATHECGHAEEREGVGALHVAADALRVGLLRLPG